MTFRLYALSFLPLGINIFLSVYLQSILRSKDAAVIAVFRGLVLNCILLYLLPVFWEAAGIWVSFSVTEGLVSVFGLLYVLRIKDAEREEKSIS